MNLSDLRDELAVRARETDDQHGDLLPGVRRRITTTKRRRAAGVIGAVAAIVAVAFGILPALTGTGDPEPVETPPVPSPKDFTQHGITFPGVVEGDRLQEAAVGDHGQNVVEFDWTPTSKALTICPLCTFPDLSRMLRVTVEDLKVWNEACHGSIVPDDRRTFVSSDTLWLDVQPGKRMHVRVELTDPVGKPTTERQAQIGVGLYTPDPQAPAMPPRQPPPASS